ncbi:MAG: DVU_1557 family redox protein [Eubacteriales bacterium]
MQQPEIKNEDGLICSKCNVLLEPGKVHITYLASTFPAELLKCPICGLVYVPEDLALGKMAEVEKTLEDK